MVPETFQNPPANLIAESAHFARMAIYAKLGGANFYRPKAAESVGIPTGDSMGQSIWATRNVFDGTYLQEIDSPLIDARKAEIIDEAMAVLEACLHVKNLSPDQITPDFWRQWKDTELIDLIVTGGKSGTLDCQRAAAWDLKRHVKVHRDHDGITRYIKGYTPLNVDASRCVVSEEDVKVEVVPKPNKKEKVVLATVGADAHVNGINIIREAFQRDVYKRQDHHPGRPQPGRRIGRSAGILHGFRRCPVRLLYPRHDSFRQSPAGEKPPAFPGGNPQGLVRKPVPLHRLFQNH